MWNKLRVGADRHFITHAAHRSQRRKYLIYKKKVIFNKHHQGTIRSDSLRVWISVSVFNFRFFVSSALRIFLLYVTSLHGHQLIDSQRLRDSRIPLAPRAPLHPQTLCLPHTLEPQLPKPNPSLQHPGPGCMHHQSESGTRQREPLQEHTGMRGVIYVC